jgi:uncharacterized protein YgiM (DUF1202 family)
MSLESKKMSLKKVIFLLCVVSFVSVGFGEDTAVAPPAMPEDVNASSDAAHPPFPYFAIISGDNVNARSGPGTQYYSCGIFFRNDKIKIAGSQFNWSKIEAPANFFSWVSKQYVKVDPNNKAVGTITADAVRIYAGSEKIKPIHSTTVQAKLNRGQKVALLGYEEDDYYKVSPPSEAFFWVDTRYTEPIFESKNEEEPAVIAENQPIVPFDGEPVPPADSKEEQPVAVADETVKPAVSHEKPNVPSVETQRFQQYRDVEEKIKIERLKPLNQQDYSTIKPKLYEIAADTKAPRAAEYAQYTLEQITKAELAITASKEITASDSELVKAKQQIEQEKQTKMGELKPISTFAVQGVLKISNIYGPEIALRHYIVVDESGKVICYAYPIDKAKSLDINSYIGKKVGLVGTIEPHPETSGALVKFSEIVIIQ